MSMWLLFFNKETQKGQAIEIKPYKTQEKAVEAKYSSAEPRIVVTLYDNRGNRIRDCLHESIKNGCGFGYRLLFNKQALKNRNGDTHCEAMVRFMLDALSFSVKEGSDDQNCEMLPHNIEGRSADLLFALAVVTDVMSCEKGYQPYAATGKLDEPTGAVYKVDYVQYKLEAALAKLKQLPGEKFFFYPIENDNDEDIPQSLRKEAETHGVVLCPLSWFNEALQRLRVPLDLFEGNPYVGARPFEAKDHNRFCGRDKEIRELRTKLEQTSALLIIGGSGSGRTSLVKSGLIPSLHSHPLKGKNISGYQIFRPRDLFSGLSVEPTVDQLFYSLKEKFPKDWVQAIDTKTQQTPPDPIQFSNLAYQWRPPKFASNGYWLWIIDSLEDIFSYSEAVIEGFAAFFAEIRNKPDVKIIATLRYDYKNNYQKQLNAIFGRRQQYDLKPMTGAQLDAMIKTPAERSDCPPVVFEVKDGKSLADTLRDDISEPEAMPWLQLALCNLYERAYARHQLPGEKSNRMRSSIEIRFEDYEALGKMQGFIVQEANNFVQSLPDEIKKDMPVLLEYLILDKPVKRKKPNFADNIIQSKINLAKKLIDSRLLVVSLSDFNDVIVTLAHDCLLAYLPLEQKFITAKKNMMPLVEMPTIIHSFFKK